MYARSAMTRTDDASHPPPGAQRSSGVGERVQDPPAGGVGRQNRLRIGRFRHSRRQGAERLAGLLACVAPLQERSDLGVHALTRAG